MLLAFGSETLRARLSRARGAGSPAAHLRAKKQSLRARQLGVPREETQAQRTPTTFFLNYSLNCYILFDPGCLLETETSSRAGAHILDLPCVLNKIQLPGVPNVFVHQAGASFFFSSGFCPYALCAYLCLCTLVNLTKFPSSIPTPIRLGLAQRLGVHHQAGRQCVDILEGKAVEVRLPRVLYFIFLGTQFRLRYYYLYPRCPSLYIYDISQATVHVSLL